MGRISFRSILKTSIGLIDSRYTDVIPINKMIDVFEHYIMKTVVSASFDRENFYDFVSPRSRVLPSELEKLNNSLGLDSNFQKSSGYVVNTNLHSKHKFIETALIYVDTHYPMFYIVQSFSNF